MNKEGPQNANNDANSFLLNDFMQISKYEKFIKNIIIPKKIITTLNILLVSPVDSESCTNNIIINRPISVFRILFNICFFIILIYFE